MRPADATGGARGDGNRATFAPQQLEVEVIRHGWTVERRSKRVTRLIKDGSVLLVGAGPASDADAIKRMAAADNLARRWR